MDTKQLLNILDKFTESGIEELRFKDESSEVVLKRSQKVTAIAGAAPMLSAPAALPSGSPAPTAVSDPAATAPLATGNTETINSPLVGSFYRSPAPDAPVFADEGQDIKTGDTLCIIEAMKVMNEFNAEFDCQIVKILVDNGQMVEFGTPLFEVIRK
jgi:acetyl-CoA carboxylase biotin carboxyl carrier protein